MKYLEQRVEELEREVKLLRAKIKLEETRTAGLITKNNDYMYSEYVDELSKLELETSFATAYFNAPLFANDGDTITFSLSSITLSATDNDFPNYPSYTGSWDDESYSSLIYKEHVDEYGLKLNESDVLVSWDHTSSFDKKDKDFLEYLNTKKEMKTYTEQNIERIFGKIVSKFTILHHCWEGDGYGYVVEKEGKKILVLTNHSNPYAATKEEINLKIGEYKSAIQETERALFLIK